MVNFYPMVFITMTKGIYLAVRTESLSVTRVNFCLHMVTIAFIGIIR